MKRGLIPKERLNYIKLNFLISISILIITAFDNSIFGQNLMVLRTPQQTYGLESYLFIHDLGKEIKYFTHTFNPERLLNISDFVENDKIRVQNEISSGLDEAYLNPFSQPCNCTKYYGSGDVDGDGTITSNDYVLVQDMLSDKISKSIEADVNGDGVIDNADLELINAAISGSLLPGWWNRLQTRAERNNWINMALAIDRTNDRAYSSYDGHWYQCINYAIQLFINFSGFGYKKDQLRDNIYDGGIAKFNIPLYIVDVQAPYFGHAINAVLVGDDPLNFYDWRFIEPQTDLDVKPGDWDMPYNSIIFINYPFEIYPVEGYSTMGPLIRFHVSGDGVPNLLSFDPGLILSRPTTIPELTKDNIVDEQYPVFVKGNFNIKDRIFSYGLNFDPGSMSIDIFSQEFENRQLIGTRHPAIVDQTYTYLSDVIMDEFSITHLIWKGEVIYYPGFYSPGIFYASLNNGSMSSITKLSVGDRFFANRPRLIRDSRGNMHSFWTESRNIPSFPVPPSVYWKRYNGNSWDPEEQIVLLESDVIYPRRIGIAADSLGNIHLVFQRENNLFYMKYDGFTWSAEIPLTSFVTSLSKSWYASNPDITADTFDNLHLVYEKQYGCYLVPNLWYESDIIYKRFSNGSWEEDTPLTTDFVSQQPSVAWYDGKLYTAWQSSRNSIAEVFLKIFDGSLWGDDIKISEDANAISEHPRVGLTSDGYILVYWQDKKGYSTQVRFATFEASEAVSAPTTLSGPTSGIILESYSYTTGGSSSSLDHPLEYQFDWKGDGTDLSPWGSATQSKVWANAGVYNVKSRARCTTDTPIVSGWSVTLTVYIVCPTSGTPSSPLPLDGATGVSAATTLSWAATANTDSYDVYFGTSTNPPLAGNVTSTSYPSLG